jgi:hypothetical protein
MKRFLRNNGLSIVFILLFLFSLAGQIYFGFNEHNDQLREDHVVPISLWQYLSSGPFIQATFENWESEFLQMALFVLLTISLRQKGSSESKSLDEEEDVDREPSPNRPDAPWPVRKGGVILFLYKNSLFLAFFIIFLLSFVLHFYGSLKDQNEQLTRKGEAMLSAVSYLTNARFWFESFQNWQSEFLSVFAIVFFSIYFRQKGSPQSKPVDSPDDKTGE